MVGSRGVNLILALSLILSHLAMNITKANAAASLSKNEDAGVSSPGKASTPPALPVVIAPEDWAENVATTATLQVYVNDADNDGLQVSFYGRQKASFASQNFTIAAIPDTQFYTVNTGGNYYFNAETSWIANNQEARHIVFAAHTGDITQNGDNDTDDSEWVIADTAMSVLERDPSNPADDVPYSVSPGNHDYLGSGFTHYNAHFPASRFAGKPYYGGHYGSDNSNSYSLFSASGMHFIVINLACTGSTPPTGVLDWADGLLKDDVSRRGIVVCHGPLESDGSFSAEGLAVYDALKDNPNWFLMLAGHAGEAQRADPGTDGHTIYSLMADFEGYSKGGSGYLRLMEFQPEEDLIQVSTYSPTINGGAGGYKTDSGSQFSLVYDMQTADFNLIDTVTVPSGSIASVTWPDLANDTGYEWYAVARDSSHNTVGTVQSFTTISIPTPTPETPTPTLSPTPVTPTATLSPTPETPTATLSPTPETPTPTLSPTPVTPTPTLSPTPETPTPTLSPTPETPTATLSPTPETPTATHSPTPVTPTATLSPTPVTPTATLSPTPETPTPTLSPTPVTPTATLSPTPVTPTATLSPTPVTPTSTLSPTPVTPTPTLSPTPETPTPTLSPTPETPTPTLSPTPVTPTATQTSYTISGRTGISGATLVTGNGGTVIYGKNGAYTILVPYNWSGTVRPLKAGYSFNPASRSYANINTDIQDENYVTVLVPPTGSYKIYLPLVNNSSKH